MFRVPGRSKRRISYWVLLLAIQKVVAIKKGDFAIGVWENDAMDMVKRGEAKVVDALVGLWFSYGFAIGISRF